MIPDCALSQVTLEHFRRAAAGPQPMPAGVAIAAVSAAFALGLVAKMLAIVLRRGPDAPAAARIGLLAAVAQSGSQRMLQLASEDIAAFEGFLSARRLPHATEPEARARQQSIDSAVSRAIELPLAAAREAAAGVQLCQEVLELAPIALVADLGVAASLLAGALRAFALCAQSNVDQLAPDATAYRAQLAAEVQLHERALRQADAVLERARAKP